MLMIFIRSNSTYILSLSIKKSIFSDEEFETIIIRLLFRPTILLLVIYFLFLIEIKSKCYSQSKTGG